MLAVEISYLFFLIAGTDLVITTQTIMLMNVNRYFILGALLVTLSGCYNTRKSHGGGQIKQVPQRTIHTADIALPPGYTITAVATGLTFPTAATVDDKGDLYVIEAGYSYGEIFGLPRLLKINADGSTRTITTGTNNGPWTSIVWFEGNFYVSEGGETSGGKILRINREGQTTVLTEGLPSMGDHHTDALIVKEGYIYFGQGTVTNSSVVGPDNLDFGWLKRNSSYHDIPCKDITLAGVNYTDDNVLTSDPNDKTTTGAFLPYGTPSTPGQVIKGRVPCTGAIMRIPLSGGSPEVVAWGLRNPFGLSLAPDGRIYTTESAYDVRGSRPVWGAGDVLWEVKQDAWYGFPDYSGGLLMEEKGFKVPGKGYVKSVLKDHPSTPPKPVAVLGVHASANGLDFSTSDAFGHKGEAFIAEFGDMAPNVGKVLAPVGFKIVRVNVNTGVIEDFAVNKGKNAPASMQKKGGLERPLSVRFDPSGRHMYVVDFGIMKMSKNKGPEPQQGTGVVWKITRKS